MRFFATRPDLLPVLEQVEAAGAALKYTRTGQFPIAKAEAFARGVDIPLLGQATANSAANCDAFLVTLHTVPVAYRRINRDDGSVVHAVDELINPDSVTFAPGGLYGDDFLLRGDVSTVSDSVEARNLMRRFNSVIRKRFTKVGAFFVGPDALRLLKDGKRLTAATQSPRQSDLSVPEDP